MKHMGTVAVIAAAVLLLFSIAVLGRVMWNASVSERLWSTIPTSSSSANSAW